MSKEGSVAVNLNIVKFLMTANNSLMYKRAQFNFRKYSEKVKISFFKLSRIINYFKVDTHNSHTNLSFEKLVLREEM